MSYKAYKDKNGNYEIKNSKDEALEGAGNILGTVIGGVILAPFMAFHKLSSKNGKLLGTDNDCFIIFVDGKEQNFPMESLESIHYGFNALQFKFINSPKISVLKINESKIKEHLTELYTMLQEKRIEVPLVAPLEIHEWHETFIHKLKSNTVSKKAKEKKESNETESNLRDIRYWKQLLDEKIITKEEFSEKKKELLKL